MPKKANKTSSKEKKLINTDFLSGFKWDDSYVSLAVGLIVVVIIAILGVVFFQGNRSMQGTSSTQFEPSVNIEQSEEESMETEGAAKGGKGTHAVKAGDTLWSISETHYKSGYNWVDIAKANKLTDSNTIISGSKLILPNVEAKQTTITQTPEKAKGISGNTYKIAKGDDLWNIAVRAYGDGYSWVKIAKANNLSNPNLIFSGNTLKIPR